jgi:hypothetical protein
MTTMSNLILSQGESETATALRQMTTEPRYACPKKRGDSVTLLRRERLQILGKRRIELVSLIAASEHKPDNETFIRVLRDRVTEIDQLIAEVEFYRA